MACIILVGCGNMGSALLKGWVNHGFDAEEIYVVEPNDLEMKQNANPKLNFYCGVEEIPGNIIPDLVLFAVKPQIMDLVLPQYTKYQTQSVYVSIAAGKTINFLESHLGKKAAIVRGMPNTPSLIGKGICGVFANDNISENQRKLSNDLMGAVGEVCWVDRESLMDAVTAISGSGPAYIYLLSECLTAAGKELGLPEELSDRLARATIYGSGKLLTDSDKPPSTLRLEVTSPGGTTEAALKVLMGEKKLEKLMGEAISMAYERSKELAK